MIVMERNGASAIISCDRPMFDLAVLSRRSVGYAADADPLTAASNRLALILASNQPFYPLYVQWVTGEINTSLGLTFLSTPFFLASPWISKRFPGVGRMWFPAVGAINTFFCGFIFGDGSGIECFLLPCIVIASLSCRATERGAFIIYCVFLVSIFTILHGRYGLPLLQTQSAQAALRSLNGYSASALIAISLWILGRARFMR